MPHELEGLWCPKRWSRALGCFATKQRIYLEQHIQIRCTTAAFGVACSIRNRLQSTQSAASTAPNTGCTKCPTEKWPPVTIDAVPPENNTKSKPEQQPIHTRLLLWSPQNLAACGTDRRLLPKSPVSKGCPNVFRSRSVQSTFSGIDGPCGFIIQITECQRKELIIDPHMPKMKADQSLCRIGALQESQATLMHTIFSEEQRARRSMVDTPQSSVPIWGSTSSPRPVSANEAASATHQRFAQAEQANIVNTAIATMSNCVNTRLFL